jgi:hypothetical protein
VTDRAAWKLLPPCWGIFDIDGQWRPNPHLRIDETEQRRQNIANGYMTPDGKLVKLPLPVDWWQN